MPSLTVKLGPAYSALMGKVTMAAVARELGVSKNTISLALRADPSIPEATRRRVAEAARRMGYSLNPTLARLMSELRRGEEGGVRHTLALLNAYPDREALRRHPTLPPYVEGVRERARFHGYGVDEFWLHDPESDGRALRRVLDARGIRGAVVVGLMRENRLPSGFDALWNDLACVVTGVRTREPALSFACVDHHALVVEAVERVRSLGYRRPALVMEPRIDRLVDGRFEAGMWTGQRLLPERDRIDPFRDVAEARRDPRVFLRWFRRTRPDVLLTLFRVVEPWLERGGVRVPADVGLVTLERRPDAPHLAGMDQHNELTGAAAVDMVVAQLLRNETGLPVRPRATLTEPEWVDGATLRAR